MKKFLIILIITFCYDNLYSQVFEDFCSTDGSLKSAIPCPIDFSDISNEPVKYVNVHMVFLRRNDGTGGFQQADQDHQDYINDMIYYSNEYMSNIPSGYDSNCYDGSQGLIYDSKIRFDFSRHYVNNTSAWINTTSALNAIRDSLLALSTEPSICMFFTEAESPYQDIIVNQNCPYPQNNIPKTSYANGPTTNFSQHLYANMRGFFLKYYWMMNCIVGNSNEGSPSSSEVYDWLKVGRIQAHELCHNLNLGDFDYPETCICAQHLMMHNACGSGNFLSPLEVSDMHTALSALSSRKYVSSTTYSSTPYSISTNTTWGISLRIYRGINHTAGTFQINNVLIVPAEVDIVTTNSAHLIFNNATVYPARTNAVPELRAESNATIEINNSTISNFEVSIEDNAKIIIKNSTINIPSGRIFSTEQGTEFTMTSGLIQ